MGSFCFLHLVVLVSFTFSISLLAPAALISVRTVFPHVRDFVSGSWSSSEFLFLFFFHEKMVLPLGRSHRSFGVCSLMSSVLCASLPCSALESAASFRGEPLWDLILMRKVLAPTATRSCRICTISRTRSPSGVVVKFARVPSPTHLFMVLRRDSLSVRYNRSWVRCVFLRNSRRVACSTLFELSPSLPRPTPVQYLELWCRMFPRLWRSLAPV